jgi:hypothetical protein
VHDRLADPPDRVRDELDALGVVIFSRGAQQADVSFIDQVGQRDAVVLITLRDRDDEPEVRAYQFANRCLVAGANPAAERELVFSRHETIRSDLVQIGRKRVVLE